MSGALLPATKVAERVIDDRARPLVASFAAGVALWNVAWRHGARGLKLERINSLYTPACASPPSIALRPRVAARWSMSGASWPAMAADGCTSFCKELRDGFGVLAPVGRTAANASRFPPRDPVREAGAEGAAVPCLRPRSAAPHVGQ